MTFFEIDLHCVKTRHIFQPFFPALNIVHFFLTYCFSVVCNSFTHLAKFIVLGFRKILVSFHPITLSILFYCFGFMYSWRMCPRASLVAQWLRIRLPVQGTRVWSLVRKDPTCRGATKPEHHNYWACALEPPCSTTREATSMRSPLTATKSSPCSPQLEKARTQQRRPNAAKNK